MLVANDGNRWLQRESGIQMQEGEDEADGGAAQASGLSDEHAGLALAARLFDEGRFQERLDEEKHAGAKGDRAELSDRFDGNGARTWRRD